MTAQQQIIKYNLASETHSSMTIVRTVCIMMRASQEHTVNHTQDQYYTHLIYQ